MVNGKQIQTLLQNQKGALRMKQNKNAIENMQSKEKTHRHEKFWWNKANDNSSNLQLLNMMSANNLRACKIFLVPLCSYSLSIIVFFHSEFVECIMQICVEKWLSSRAQALYFAHYLAKVAADEQLSTEISRFFLYLILQRDSF